MTLQIRYPVHFGRLVHSLAIPAVLLSIALMPRAKAGPRPIVAVLRGAGVWLAAAIMGMALPAALGVLRVVLTGVNYLVLDQIRLEGMFNNIHVLTLKVWLLPLDGTRDTAELEQVTISVAGSFLSCHLYSPASDTWQQKRFNISDMLQHLVEKKCLMQNAIIRAGKPMIWFGRNYLAYAIYAPAAVAGILIPLAAFPPLAYGLDAAVLGVALVQALETAVLTALGMKSTFAFALWAFAAAASALYPGKAVSFFAQLPGAANDVKLNHCCGLRC